MNGAYLALVHSLEVQILRHGRIIVKVLHVVLILLVLIRILKWLLLRHLLLTMIRWVALIWRILLLLLLLLMKLLRWSMIHWLVLVFLWSLLLHHLLVHWRKRWTLRLLLFLRWLTVHWSSLGSLVLQSLRPRLLYVVLLALGEGCITILRDRVVWIVGWEFLRRVATWWAISSLILYYWMWLLFNLLVSETAIRSRILPQWLLWQLLWIVVLNAATTLHVVGLR